MKSFRKKRIIGRKKNSWLYFYFFIVLLISSGCNSGFYAFPEPDKEIKPVDNFSQLQIPLELKSNVKKSRLTTFVFLSAECPICSNCAEELEEAYQSVKAQDVSFYAVFPNKERRRKIRKFRKYYALSFPVYKDKKKSLSGFFKIAVTPQAAIIDNQTNLIYKGALDNRNRGKETGEAGVQHFFMDAIQNYLKGADIQVSNTEPVGCHIHEKRNKRIRRH